ncbi:MAG: alanine racemase [Planctomycetes bacterium]|nr:alanine racemase [Planctomycetota bacterium]
MEAYRVWSEIDLDALAWNLASIRARIGASRSVMLVVKADAYGHGAIAVAHHALRHGVEAFGVGTSAEALTLRKAGLRARLLVLGTIVEDEAPACLRHGIEIAVHSADRCRRLQALARRMDVRARVHLKIDTGMGRLGVMPARALSLLELIHASPNVELAGVMTHMSAAAGALDPHTQAQMRQFDGVLAAARERGLLRGPVHAANSACIFTGLDPLYDMVRPGISAYGVLPGKLPGASELEPVMSLHTQVVFLKDLPAGAPVGYGGTFKAKRATRIAILPLGYHDGVNWRLGNRGAALVRGDRAPIVGRVSMDYTTLDVTDIPQVRVGDRVTLIGRQGEHVIRLEDLAKAAKTIAYEISCAVGQRVERVYVGGEDVVPRRRARSEPARSAAFEPSAGS